MNIKAKLVFQSPIWLNRMRIINKKARQYKKQPEYNPLQKRADLLIKYAGKLLKTFKIELEVIGLENLYKAPCLLVPNHTSNMDVVALMYSLRKLTQEQGVENNICTFIAKQELLKKKTVRNVMSLLDTFTIDRSKPREALEVAKDFAGYIKANKTYGVIFPEGTRSKDGNIGEFKSGAFAIAQSEYLPIIPISIINGFKADDTKRSQKLKMKIVFHKAIKPITFVSQDRKNLAKNVQNIVERGIKEHA